MTAQRTRPNPIPLLITLALLGCGSDGSLAENTAARAAGREHPEGVRVSVTIERTDPYTESLPPAEDLPSRFEPDGERVEIGECQPRLVDPRGGVRLRAAETRTSSRSTQRGDTTFVLYRAYGDYIVQPASAYGLAPGERLRVDCGGNVPIGRVASPT